MIFKIIMGKEPVGSYTVLEVTVNAVSACLTIRRRHPTLDFGDWLGHVYF